MMRIKKNTIATIIVVVYGLLFGIISNIFFDSLLKNIWTPIAIALLFLLFSVFLSVLIFLFAKKLGHDKNKKSFIKEIAIVLVAVFLTSMLFEFLYELGLNYNVTEPDSYVLLIDDSGSMEENDPQNKRKTAINTLLKDKDDSFNYAVYVFSNSVDKVRDMQPKSKPFNGMELSSEGGTAMFGCLRKVLDDIESGNLKITTVTRVLLLSDGYASDNPVFKSKLLKKYVNNNIVISTIGLGDGVDTKTMEQIAEYTGGVYIHINDSSMLDTAMLDASVQTSARNLLGFRGFCETNILHAILRVVFLLIIIALIYMSKIYSCGKYYMPHLIVAAILSVIAGFIPEIALQVFSFNENLVRILFWTLISVALFEYVEKCPNRVRRSYSDDYEYEYEDNDDWFGASTLNSKQSTDGSTDINTLG